MFANKTSFINIVIWSLLICFIYGKATIIKSTDTGTCECGAFYQQDEIGENTFIFSHNLINTTCNNEGRFKCLSLCTNLVEINKQRDSELICQRLIFAKAIKIMMFTRLCIEDWVYGNVTAKNPMCCFKGIPICM